MRGHAIVCLEGLLVAVEVQHGVQEAHHGHAVLQGEPLEIGEGREHLAQGGGELRECAGAEDGRGGLEAVGGEEGGRGELREHILLLDAKLRHEPLDIRVVLPETARARLKGLPRGGEVGSPPCGVGQPVEERDLAPVLAQRLGRAPSAPARAHHRHVRLVRSADLEADMAGRGALPPLPPARGEGAAAGGGAEAHGGGYHHRAGLFFAL
mmetsp:Transcript_69647/g.220534  ORF Transcript_69647/g.220534 Transcript_69647/m.220534 type:complete len:210 (-) Transcript_69647:36-665(-)